jgi:hypothetical protein
LNFTSGDEKEELKFERADEEEDMANKVQRRGRSKVSRRIKPNKLSKGLSNNPLVQKNWDRTATLKQNYAKLGIQASVNSLSTLPYEVTSSKEAAMVLDTEFKAPESLTRNSNRDKFFVDENERAYLEQLIERFGRDYKAMERDILKLNYLQKSAQHLETRIKRLREYKLQVTLDEKEQERQAAEKGKEEFKKSIAIKALEDARLKLEARRILKGKSDRLKK